MDPCKGQKSLIAGLELACKPYTLRIASLLHDKMDAAHEALLVEAGKKIREALVSTGVTGHPILAAHPPQVEAGKKVREVSTSTAGPGLFIQAAHSSQQPQALALAQHERFCSASQLRQALEIALDWQEWQMFICRYGIKTSAEELFPSVLAAHAANEQQLGSLRARTAWTKASADFGTQTTLNGNPAVVYPNPSMRFSKQFKWFSRLTYPLFGLLGGGFGGMQVQGADGSNVVKAVVYPGNYVHQVKALGAPNIAAPKNSSARWFANQWVKLKTMVAQLFTLDDIQVAGLRMEFRLSGLETTWLEQQQYLSTVCQELCKHLDVQDVSFEATHADSVEALKNAEEAGLFQCRGNAQTTAPAWKVQNYGRLMFHFGLSDKYTNRFALKQARQGQP